MKSDFSELNQTGVSHCASFKKVENQIGKISTQLNTRTNNCLPSDINVNRENDAQVLAIVIRSGMTLGDYLKEDLADKMPMVKSK